MSHCKHLGYITQIDGNGRYHIHCTSCGLDGKPRNTVTEAYLRRCEDLREAEKKEPRS